MSVKGLSSRKPEWTSHMRRRKGIFVLLTGVCVLGIAAMTFYTKIWNLTSPLSFCTSLDGKNNRSIELFNSVWSLPDNTSLSTQGQLGENIRALSLTNRTGSEALNILELPSRRRNKNLSSMELQEKILANQNTDPLQEVKPITTMMTFNKSLEVRCKESPYIVCTPPIARMRSEKIFKVSLLRQPTWQPVGAIKVSLCSYQQCEFVQDTITADTDVVVVYGVRLTDNFQPPPRWSHQLYVFSVWEPPFYMHYVKDANSVWNEQFNLTMTYRLDSDIFTPYSQLRFNPLPPEKRPNYYEIAQNKTGTVIWIVSHCKSQSRRQTYVKEMQQYIDVDIFGKCGKRCSGGGDFTCGGLPSRYKFYLSFENSLCMDYVTEKFFKLFLPGMHVIPVVRGAVDYDKYFPNFTYINAANFKTAKDLALHLKDLAADLNAYSKYLEYKDLYQNINASVNLACRTCEYLHTHKVSQPKTYNLKTWLFDGQCRGPTDI